MLVLVIIVDQLIKVVIVVVTLATILVIVAMVKENAAVFKFVVLKLIVLVDQVVAKQQV